MKKKLILGNEYDKKVRQALTDCLAALGAEMAAWQWGLGGSQVLETRKVYLGKELLVIEAETYVGLSITGPSRIVDSVAKSLAAKLEVAND